MTPHPKTTKWLLPAIAALALACSARLALAQSAQDAIVSQFDDGTVQGWAFNYGGATPTTLTNSPDMNRGDAGPGALNITAPFNLCTLAGNNQTDFEKVLAVPLDLTKYTKLHFSVYVDTNSAHLSDWGAAALGNLRPHIRLATWGGDVDLGASTANNQWIAVNNYGTWMDYSMTIDQTGAGKLPTLQACGILGFQIWSGWGTCAAPIGLTNTISFWMDNIWFEWNTNTAPPPPPTTTLSKAGPSGVLVALGANGGQWDRQALTTPGPNSNYMWTAQGGYPVSYSCTIKDFPPLGTHLGYEAHMYIVNGETGNGRDLDGATDWDAPDLLIFRIENHVTTTYTTNGTTITTNSINDTMAQIQWKTNYPGANSTNIPVVVFPPNAHGTWTVTFTDATHGSLSGPGLTATNFTLPSDAVANSFSPTTNSFVQFGNFKNDGANDGHNNNATGTFGHATIAGTAAPIDDDFSSATLTNKYAWRKTSANEVQYVAPGTAWYLNWTLPALGFHPYVAPSVKGPWSVLALASEYQNGTNMIGTIATSALPAGNDAFFRMASYPYVKLQVLMPGETAAPGTLTGKTGTPTAQTAGIPFDIMVNAVDQYWNVCPSTNIVGITSSDLSATLLPTSAALVNGTNSFTVAFGTAGTWTVTATDATDATKLPNTGSPTQAQ